MDLGCFMMPLHPPGSDFAKTLEHDLSQIVHLDRLGYREAWIGEHFTAAWENIPAPDLFIAQALGQTKNIRLGTGVSCMPNHNPFVLAHRIAQLDNMAQGRFQWGVGAGGFPGDLEVFGYGEGKKDHRAMMQQSVTDVLDIWDDPTPGYYSNEFYDYTVPEPVPGIGLGVHVKPYQKPHPPIGISGVSPKSGSLAAAGARGWLPLSINIVPNWVLKTHWEAYSEGAEKAGRQPDRADWRIAREVFIADTTEAARDEVRNGVMRRDWEEYFWPLLQRDGLLSLAKIDPDMADEDCTVEYMMENVWIVGSPDDVTAKLSRLYEEVGGFGVLLIMAHEWEPLEAWQRSAELLKEVVVPQLAAVESGGA